MGCCDWWSLFLTYHSFPVDFVVSQWQDRSHGTKLSMSYLAFRSVMVLIMLTLYIVDLAILSNAEREQYPLLITSWVSTLVVAFEICDLILVLNEIRLQRNDVYFNRRNMSFLHMIVWHLSNARAASAITVTIFFWVVFYDNAEMPLQFYMFFSTVINVLAVLADLAFSARPWRWQHFYQPANFMLTYLLFTMIYDVVSNNDFIYTELDWDEEKIEMAIGIGCGLVIVAIVMHFAIYGLYKLRTSIWRRRKVAEIDSLK